MGKRRKYSEDELLKIIAKTHGYCHLCPAGPYSLDDYGEKWQVEHSTPLSKDGRDDIRNWYVACVTCNQCKGVESSASFRNKTGVGGVPFSTKERTRHAMLNFVRIPAILLIAALGLMGLEATIDGPERVSQSRNKLMIESAVVGGLLLAVAGGWYIFSVRGREEKPRRGK